MHTARQGAQFVRPGGKALAVGTWGSAESFHLKRPLSWTLDGGAAPEEDLHQEKDSKQTRARKR